jgi:hypothetical protein
VSAMSDLVKDGQTRSAVRGVRPLHVWRAVVAVKGRSVQRVPARMSEASPNACRARSPLFASELKWLTIALLGIGSQVIAAGRLPSHGGRAS